MRKRYYLLGWALFLLFSIGLAWNRADIEFLLGSIILAWIFMLKFVGVFDKEGVNYEF